MASKASKRITANIRGILDIADGRLFVEVEDIEKPFQLADFFRDFNGLEVAVSVAYKEEIGGDEN